MLYNLELSPGTDLLGMPLVSCLLNVGEMLGRKQEQNWTTLLGAETLGPKSPLPFEKGQDGRNLECFCV